MNEELVRRVASAANLREGPAGVEALLRAVFRAGGLPLADAARAARLPLPVASAVRRELEKAGVLERRHGLSLTADGRSYVSDVLGFAAVVDVTCPTCGGHGIVLDGAVAAARDALARHLDASPAVDVALDQAPCTPETAMRRAALMYRAGALEGRRILILGDDDSVSLALGLLGRAVAGRALWSRLTVVELDPARAAFIGRVAAAENLPVDVVAHDLREPLPPDLSSAFDVVETDPPYTLPGAELFLTRAVEGLDGGRGDVFFSFAHWPAPRMLELQRVMTDLGLAVRAVHPAFNAYSGAAVLGASGQLVELVATGRAPEPRAWSGAIYTAEVSPRVRTYRCTACGATHALGAHGVPPTIEALKARGCPVCGGRAFARARPRA